jgi:hypothetical protein
MSEQKWSSASSSDQLYRYGWGNNVKRATLKGRVCRCLWRGGMNSAFVEFVDTGQQEVISRNALRKEGGGSECRR